MDRMTTSLPPYLRTPPPIGPLPKTSKSDNGKDKTKTSSSAKKGSSKKTSLGKCLSASSPNHKDTSSYAKSLKKLSSSCSNLDGSSSHTTTTASSSGKRRPRKSKVSLEDKSSSHTPVKDHCRRQPLDECPEHEEIQDAADEGLGKMYESASTIMTGWSSSRSGLSLAPSVSSKPELDRSSSKQLNRKSSSKKLDRSNSKQLDRSSGSMRDNSTSSKRRSIGMTKIISKRFSDADDGGATPIRVKTKISFLDKVINKTRVLGAKPPKEAATGDGLFRCWRMEWLLPVLYYSMVNYFTKT